MCIDVVHNISNEHVNTSDKELRQQSTQTRGFQAP